MGITENIYIVSYMHTILSDDDEYIKDFQGRMGLKKGSGVNSERLPKIHKEKRGRIFSQFENELVPNWE